jgi:hypothetical protein
VPPGIVGKKAERGAVVGVEYDGAVVGEGHRVELFHRRHRVELLGVRACAQAGRLLGNATEL